eukprot:13600935-Heterocapsa_arctica.AAC.1
MALGPGAVELRVHPRRRPLHRPRLWPPDPPPCLPLLAMAVAGCGPPWPPWWRLPGLVATCHRAGLE